MKNCCNTYHNVAGPRDADLSVSTYTDDMASQIQQQRRAHTSKASPVSYRDLIHIRSVLKIVIVGLIIYLVVAGFGGLSHSWAAIKSANPQYIGLAILAIAGSYVAAAVTYMLLSPRRLRFGPTLTIQTAGGLVNRLLPAGLGGLGINTIYLNKRGLALPLAATVVTLNTAIGFVGNLLLVAATVLLGRLPSVQLQLPAVPVQPYILGAIVLLIVAIIVLLRRHMNRRWRLGLRDAARYLRTAATRPLHTILALGSSMSLTALHVFGLYFVLQSVGVPQVWGVVLVAISIGAAAGAAVPTPGGLGGAEAGIAAVLIAYGVSADNAVAAALVYRGITYWLPLLPGYFALRVADKRYL